ncbi:MAG: hypothetical protein O7B81_13420 [Gammaproteobacteria bacterium]|nr:hypothetical protein [Gammaproteobacteria bacterium]
MSEKIDAIKNHLLKRLPGRNIEYSNASGFHKFRIEGECPTHWLYMSEETVDDSELAVLINLLNIYHIATTVSQSSTSKWLYLSDMGVREVDENFTK